jgi:hypothetical protein
LHGAGVFEKLEGMAGFFTSSKTRGAEEDNRVLNLLAAEARQRLQILRNNPYGPSVGTVEKCRILVRKRRCIELRRASVAGIAAWVAAAVAAA